LIGVVVFYRRVQGPGGGGMGSLIEDPDPGAAIRLHVHRRDRLGGIIHEY
jgi:hypothetical protein